MNSTYAIKIEDKAQKAATITLETPQKIEIEVSAKAISDTIYEEQEVTFTVDVTNKSNVTAKNVSIEASLPEELGLVSKPENFDIEAGKTVTKTITAKVKALPEETKQKDITTTIKAIPNGKEDQAKTAEVKNVIKQALIKATIEDAYSDGAEFIYEGGQLGYKTTITNVSDETLTNVVITSKLPEGTKLNTKEIGVYKYEATEDPDMMKVEKIDIDIKESEKNGSIIYIIPKLEKGQTINNSDGKIRSVVYEKAGEQVELEGDIFISSMPLKDLTAGMNSVPENIAAIAKGLPYRDFVTVGLLVDKLNLKNQTNIKTINNIVPDCWIYVQDVDVKLGRIQIFNNWSPYLVKDIDHKVWIGLEYFCNEGDDFYNMSDEECIRFASQELVKMGIISDEKAVLDAHREKVKKAYPAYFDTYDQIDELVDYLNTYDNLYCVGRNGQHRYNNMDHSMVTSFEAVDNIIKDRKDKSNIWNVNTEGEYHEQK